MTRAQAHLASVDRVLHLIGIADEALAGRRMRVEGERITIARHEKIALLLRTVDAEAWAPQALDLKKNDANWLAHEARLHEAIISRAMTQGTVVPIRPFTVFPDAAALEAAARSQYTRWRRTLTRIAGKAEWALHVYRGPHAIPPVRPYLLRTALARPQEAAPADDAAPKVARPLGDHVVQVWKACSALATAARRIDAHADPQQLFCATFLLPHSRNDALREALERLHPHAKALGLTYYLEGPRPAFNFV
jgi:hypothetical protein